MDRRKKGRIKGRGKEETENRGTEFQTGIEKSSSASPPLISPSGQDRPREGSNAVLSPHPFVPLASQPAFLRGEGRGEGGEVRLDKTDASYLHSQCVRMS